MYRCTIIYLHRSNTTNPIIVQESSLFMGGPMFVAFVGNPCPQFYIPTNVTYATICLIFICYQRNHDPMNQENFAYPRTLTPMNKNDSTVFNAFDHSLLSIYFT